MGLRLSYIVALINRYTTVYFFLCNSSIPMRYGSPPLGPHGHFNYKNGLEGAPGVPRAYLIDKNKFHDNEAVLGKCKHSFNLIADVTVFLLFIIKNRWSKAL